jgi:hypothetical protein
MNTFADRYGVVALSNAHSNKRQARQAAASLAYRHNPRFKSLAPFPSFGARPLFGSQKWGTKSENGIHFQSNSLAPPASLLAPKTADPHRTSIERCDVHRYG